MELCLLHPLWTCCPLFGTAGGFSSLKDSLESAQIQCWGLHDAELSPKGTGGDPQTERDGLWDGPGAAVGTEGTEVAVGQLLQLRHLLHTWRSSGQKGAFWFGSFQK